MSRARYCAECAGELDPKDPTARARNLSAWKVPALGTVVTTRRHWPVCPTHSRGVLIAALEAGNWSWSTRGLPVSSTAPDLGAEFT